MYNFGTRIFSQKLNNSTINMQISNFQTKVIQNELGTNTLTYKCFC